MALTYLVLTNEVLSRLNEVELTSSTFAAATGFHGQAKRAVNSAIREINRKSTEWPFNYAATTQLLTIGQQEYTFAATTKSADWDTFYLVKNDSLEVSTTWLPPIDYDAWVQSRRDHDLDADATAEYGVPEVVYRAQANLTFGVSPKPNKAYTVSYQRWLKPVDLSAHGDTTTVPDDYLEVIVTGAMQYAYAFRDNFEQAAVAKKDFKQGVDEMQRILIPQATVMQSGLIARNLRRDPNKF